MHKRADNEAYSCSKRRLPGRASMPSGVANSLSPVSELSCSSDRPVLPCAAHVRSPALPQGRHARRCPSTPIYRKPPMKSPLHWTSRSIARIERKGDLRTPPPKMQPHHRCLDEHHSLPYTLDMSAVYLEVG